jgi:hypothetical protein
MDFKHLRKNQIIYKWNTLNSVRKYIILQKTKLKLFIYDGDLIKEINRDIYNQSYTTNSIDAINKNIEVIFYKKYFISNNTEIIIKGNLRNILLRGIKKVKKKKRKNFS